jgi:ketosteroid isomerase-like protein
MNLTANKRLVARFFELLNAGAHDEAVSLFTNDFIWSIPESTPGGGSKRGQSHEADHRQGPVRAAMISYGCRRVGRSIECSKTRTPLRA